MPAHAALPPANVLDIDPARFGISGSAEGLKQFTAAIAARLGADIDAQVQARLQQEVARQVEEQLAQRVQVIYEQLLLARRRMFGPSSEAHAGQSRLFDEAEALAADTTAADEAAVIPPAAPREAPAHGGPKARGKRLALPAELPRLDIVHDVPEAERTCACGTPMVEIGQEISEQLDIVPMQIRVLRHIRKRYACPGGEQAPVTAPVPAQVLPKSNASNDLLVMLLIMKYVDGLPLARFEHILARAGVRVPRQTLARWVIGAARALQPLHNLMRDTLLQAPVLHLDETVVQVLKEPDKAATSNSYMWVQTGGPPGRPVVLYGRVAAAHCCAAAP